MRLCLRGGCKDSCLMDCAIPLWGTDLCWGGNGEAARLEKDKGVENCLEAELNLQHQVNVILGVFGEWTISLIDKHKASAKNLYLDLFFHEHLINLKVMTLKSWMRRMRFIVISQESGSFSGWVIEILAWISLTSPLV